MHMNPYRPGDHSQAFFEVWTDHSEGHIYQKSSLSTLGSWEGNKFEPLYLPCGQ
jgi:hypothetical protein